MKLDDGTPIFVGFKLDGQLRRQLESISGADRRYVSTDDSTFLRICRLGEDDYIGKVIYVVPGVGVITKVISPPVNYIIIAIILAILFFNRLGSGKDNKGAAQTGSTGQPPA